MPATLDAPKIALRFAQAGSGHAQSEVLREAFEERDKLTQALQEQLRQLQAADAQRSEQYSASHKQTAALGNQIKTLEETARRDAQERATKGDIALVRKDMELLHKDMEASHNSLRKEMEAGLASLRQEMAALQNSLVIKLGSIMVLALGAGAAIMKIFA